MNKSIWSYFKIAGLTAESKNDKRAFLLGATGIRSDGALVKSLNSCSIQQERTAHAEYRLASKLDYGATIYVARVKLCDGSFGMSRPCPSCMKVLRSKFVKKIYYTISDEEYGVISLKYGEITHEETRK